MNTERYKILHSYHDLGQYLMMDKISGELFIKKYPEHHEDAVYDYIKDHSSSHIPEVVEYGTDDKGFYVIEEYIKGKTLFGYLEDNEVDVESRRRILDEILDAIGFLHSATPPIIHRDIKGDNILIDKNGKVYVIDYDAAKTYKPGEEQDTELIGTIGNAAPEQYGFTQSDKRTDIYAVGLLIKEMFPGVHKYQDVASHATRFDPEQRYQTVEELRQDLDRERKMPVYLSRWFVPLSLLVMFLALIIIIRGIGRTDRTATDDRIVDTEQFSIMDETTEDTEANDTGDTDPADTNISETDEESLRTSTAGTEESRHLEQTGSITQTDEIIITDTADTSPSSSLTLQTSAEATSEMSVYSSTTPTPTVASTPAATSTPTPTPTVTSTPATTSTPTPTPRPTSTAAPSPSPTATPLLTVTPLPQPSACQSGHYSLDNWGTAGRMIIDSDDGNPIYSVTIEFPEGFICNACNCDWRYKVDYYDLGDNTVTVYYDKTLDQGPPLESLMIIQIEWYPSGDPEPLTLTFDD